MPPKEPQPIDLNTLDARELGHLKENLESEVQSLTQSAVSLQRVAGEFGKSGRAIERLAEAEEGQQSPKFNNPQSKTGILLYMSDQL